MGKPFPVHADILNDQKYPKCVNQFPSGEVTYWGAFENVFYMIHLLAKSLLFKHFILYKQIPFIYYMINEELGLKIETRNQIFKNPFSSQVVQRGLWVAEVP